MRQDVHRSVFSDVADFTQRVSDPPDGRLPTERQSSDMIPLSDGISPRNFPFVNVAIIAVNFAVWLFYELPHLSSSVYHASFYVCTVNDSCHGPEPWGISWITAMFMHGSWDHILGNMIFLFVFGKNVEDAFGHLRYLAFYFVGGFVATMAQTAATLAVRRPRRYPRADPRR